MVDSVNFPFVWETNALGESVRRPLIPISLTYNAKTVSAMALLDSGADVSVLPYQLGVELGANWDEQKFTLDLSGNLARFEARGILLSVRVGSLPPARLAFAWTQSQQARLILGQTNFFDEFSVCLHRFNNSLEIQTRT